MCDPLVQEEGDMSEKKGDAASVQEELQTAINRVLSGMLGKLLRERALQQKSPQKAIWGE